jgi:hypothetical protein
MARTLLVDPLCSVAWVVAVAILFPCPHSVGNSHCNHPSQYPPKKGLAVPFIPAKYPGNCGTCDAGFSAGDTVYWSPPEIGEPPVIDGPCCIESPQSNGADFDAFNRGRPPGIAVLPRGKTAKDRCNTCFQVPASSGACGCDGY